MPSMFTFETGLQRSLPEDRTPPAGASGYTGTLDPKSLNFSPMVSHHQHQELLNRAQQNLEGQQHHLHRQQHRQQEQQNNQHHYHQVLQQSARMPQVRHQEEDLTSQQLARVWETGLQQGNHHEQHLQQQTRGQFCNSVHGQQLSHPPPPAVAPAATANHVPQEMIPNNNGGAFSSVFSHHPVPGLPAPDLNAHVSFSRDELGTHDLSGRPRPEGLPPVQNRE